MKLPEVHPMPKKNKLRLFRPIVFSRHPTHRILREQLPLMPFRSIVRLGSVTELSSSAQSRGKYVECNSIEGIKNTSNKFDMKSIFVNNSIKTPIWFLPVFENNVLKHTTHLCQVIQVVGDDIDSTPKEISENAIKFPLIGKIHNHSRGRGMIKFDTPQDLKDFINKNKSSLLRQYSFETYCNFAKEYRIHATQNGIFYICRKLRKEDAKERWFFNSTNSIFEVTYEDNVWVRESEWPCFNELSKQLSLALSALKMDIAGFDVKINKAYEEFSIIEANSACSFGEKTGKHYINEITKILKTKGGV